MWRPVSRFPAPGIILLSMHPILKTYQFHLLNNPRAHAFVYISSHYRNRHVYLLPTAARPSPLPTVVLPHKA